jgi:hypothetical protein
MTDVVNEPETVAEPVREPGAGAGSGAVDDQLVGMLVDRAQAAGLQLNGEGGLLQLLTKRVIEAALDGEMTGHLGYAKHDPAVTTEVGPVQISLPRETEGSFEPQIVRKRQRRLTGVDEMVLSLSAKGLTHGEIGTSFSPHQRDWSLLDSRPPPRGFAMTDLFSPVSKWKMKSLCPVTTTEVFSWHPSLNPFRRRPAALERA